MHYEKKTLKQRMQDDLELRGFSPHTQKEYLMRVTHFARYFGKLPDKLGEKEVKEYFLHLVRDKHASYGVLNMTYCALKFIYTATLGRPWEMEKIPRAEEAGEDARDPRQGRSASAHRAHRQSQAQEPYSRWHTPRASASARWPTSRWATSIPRV